jgi:transposase
MTGLSYPTVRAAIDLFDAGGWAAVRPAVRGRSRGDGRVLTQAQEQAVQRLIIDQRPEQLKMDFSLWSRAAVGQLIEQEFGIKLQVRSVGKYLARWGFTPQKPIKRAYEQSPEAVKAWLETRKDQIEIFYLPSYSPELNPDERLNAELKHAIGSTVPLRTQAQLKAATESHMSKLAANPEKVKAFFNDPRCKYAA